MLHARLETGNNALPNVESGAFRLVLALFVEYRLEISSLVATSFLVDNSSSRQTSHNNAAIDCECDASSSNSYVLIRI